MSVVIPVSADWLTLRERADAESRSRALATRAARMLRPPLTVHDLGSGTGSMVRWLAPLLPGPQTWVLHDWNPALLEHAARADVHDADGGPTTMRTRVGELEHLRAADIEGASLVTASALLDVLAADEVEAIVDACVAVGGPALFGLTVNGRVELDPLDPGDRVFEAAFNDHQRRVVEGRRLLGPDAVVVAADLFRSRGWSVRVADSPWSLSSADRPLIAEWLDGWLAAAVAERPALREWAEEYSRSRSAQLAAGRLRVIVHHEDLLAWP
ncbi:SAM-dependent methyltransferase [Microbacterium sp. NPDC056003]|uniref:SAM-dependent methyltransferase n=1 Tax=Microbacterium sp. NPDC056003 TaxID=3345676 RepID=UPI0035DD58EC